MSSFDSQSTPWQRLAAAARIVRARLRRDHSEFSPRQDPLVLTAADFPVRITEPGLYILREDVVIRRRNLDAVRICARGVTLDLAGHTLHGPDSVGAGRGIAVNAGVEDCVILHGAIRAWGGCGIEIAAGAEVRIERIRANDNGADGIRTAGRGEILACFANLNAGSGFVAHSVVRLEACTASRNCRHGFVIDGAATVIDSKAAANDGDGFRAGLGEGRIAGCASVRNGGDGIHAAHGRIVHACHVGNNRGHGISVGSNCFITGNVCRANGSVTGGAGIFVAGSHNQIESNQLLANARGLVLLAPDSLVEVPASVGSPGAMVPGPVPALEQSGEHPGLGAGLNVVSCLPPG